MINTLAASCAASGPSWTVAAIWMTAILAVAAIIVAALRA